MESCHARCRLNKRCAPFAVEPGPLDPAAAALNDTYVRQDLSWFMLARGARIPPGTAPEPSCQQVRRFALWGSEDILTLDALPYDGHLPSTPGTDAEDTAPSAQTHGVSQSSAAGTDLARAHGNAERMKSAYSASALVAPVLESWPPSTPTGMQVHFQRARCDA
jgi:hypothetical protein